MKRTFKAMTSIALSALLVMQFSVGILADDNTEPPYSFFDGEEHEVSGGTLEADESSQGTYLTADNGSKVTVTDDVIVEFVGEEGEGFGRGVNVSDSEVTVNGNIKVDDVSGKSVNLSGAYVGTNHYLGQEEEEKNASLKVTEDIVVNGNRIADGVIADGNGTKAEVGNIYVSSKEDCGGSIGVEALDKAEVTTKNITSQSEDGTSIGIRLVDNAVVNVKGDIIATSNNFYATGIAIYEGAKVTVDGNVVANGKIDSNGIIVGYTDIEDDLDIKVIGDVSGSNYGILLVTDEDGRPNAKVIVEGTVSGKDAAIKTNIAGSYTPASDYQTPTIVVGKLATSSTGELVQGRTDCDGSVSENQRAVAELIAASINYIIKADSSQLSYSGSTIRRIEGYDTAREGESFLVTPGAVASDLKIDGVDAGSYATVTKNSDGTFTVTVKRGGDLVLKLKTSKKGEVVEVKEEKEEKKESSSSSSDSSSSAPAPAAPTMTTAQVVQAIQPAGSSASAAATLASVGITDAKEVATVQNAYNLTSITSEAGINQAIATAVQSEIAKVLAANFITINSGKANAKLETVQKVELLISDKISFTKSIADTIKNSNVDIVFFVKHNGQLVKITIKAGTDITPLLGQNGAVGPIALGNLLGTVEVTEQGIYSRIMQHYNK